MRGGREKNRLLPIRFLQPQVRSQQISVSDLPLLNKLLHLLTHLGFFSRWFFGGRLDKYSEPVGFRQPANARACLAIGGFERQVDLLFPAFQLAQNFPAISVKDRKS